MLYWLNRLADGGDMAVLQLAQLNRLPYLLTFNPCNSAIQLLFFLVYDAFVQTIALELETKPMLPIPKVTGIKNTFTCNSDMFTIGMQIKKNHL